MLNYILIIVAILALMYVAGGYREGFLVMGDYPHVVDTNLLECSYPSLPNPSISTHMSADLSAIQPRTAMSSYEQVTNNKKYWNTPDNGSCTPTDFCGVLYGSRTWAPSTFVAPVDTAGRRVNMFTQ
jgi:hypothetical protein